MFGYPYRFEATISLHKFGRANYAVIFLPQSLVDELPFDQHTRLRVRGEYAGHPFENAFQPVKGKYYIIVSKKRRKLCGLAVGDQVWVEFELMDQNHVHVPVELERAIMTNSTLEQAWKKLTPGKQRGFAYWIDSAKRRETRQNRVDDATEMIISGDFVSNQRTKKKKKKATSKKQKKQTTSPQSKAAKKTTKKGSVKKSSRTSNFKLKKPVRKRSKKKRKPSSSADE